MSKKLTRMWVTPKFKKAVNLERYEDPSQKIIDVVDKIADDIIGRKGGRKNPFFPKI
tara:strand:- start:882 stop:1052 length:171 start_codon:yes stop_codon:yes gene_type:complete